MSCLFRINTENKIRQNLIGLNLRIILFKCSVQRPNRQFHCMLAASFLLIRLLISARTLESFFSWDILDRLLSLSNSVLWWRYIRRKGMCVYVCVYLWEREIDKDRSKVLYFIVLTCVVQYNKHSWSSLSAPVMYGNQSTEERPC